MADIAQTRGRATARLLTLCAVLLGLFLMHGAPATAAEGCHGAMSAASPMPHGHDPAAMTSTVPDAMGSATSPPGAQQVSGASLMHGALCVSTAARDQTPLPMGGALLAVVATTTVGMLANRPVPLGRTGRRGPPPPGGRSLLLTVCIART
ncbi:hypothetical protein [Streptomyces sp. RKAG293]|uniref:hypothetical protein n=1 Tax=Streptomyces sp. RKAG293 TaxID=2893403 RepID=UPI00203426FC|nr:hypothetical protein [Streptomyces sp. RKAG293]MCM2419094.1 hypothetical protein [Streptomyces sp. RKAG293]